MTKTSAPVAPGRRAVPEKKKRKGLMAVYVRRFVRNKAAVVALAFLLIMVVFSFIGQMVGEGLTGRKMVEPDILAASEGPGPVHLLGTNSVGQDLFTMLAGGTRLSLMVALIVSLSVTLISAFVGCLAAYAGGFVEKAILWIIHFLLVVPSFLILALFGSASGGKWYVLALVLILFGWMMAARVIYSLAQSIREREYVYAARYMGVPGFQIVWRHMIPNIGSLLVIQFALGLVGVVMSETALSFLGFGIKHPDVSLGTLLSDGISQRESLPHLFYYPALILTLVTVSMALVADGLRDALDPNSASGGKA